jgi:GT2 family glycosyltransferase
VPTFQRRESLARLLSALAKQTHPRDDLEVIVVDDGSTDGTAEYLTTVRTPYALRHYAQRNSGPGAARNLGVVHARGTLIVFFDDDVVPDASAVAAHVAAHAAQPDTVVIGPMLPPRVWPRPAWIRWEEDRLLEQYGAMIAGRYACTPRQLFTANASMARRTFIAAGGFDPGFARAEDVELGYRLRDLGSRFAFEPRAAVVHFPVRSFASWRRTPYQYGRGDVAMDRVKGHQALGLAFWEFHRRHVLNRAAARLCVGRPPLFVPVSLGLRAVVRVADAFRLRRVARAALSALFNLLYWQGVADGLGSRSAVWRSVAAHAGVVG